MLPPAAALTSSLAPDPDRGRHSRSDLLRAAADVVRPAGAQLGAMIDDARRYRACWLVELRRVPFGPAFERGRDCYRFIDILTGEERTR